MAKLGEVCLLKAGKFVSANDISPEYNKGLYPCFGGNGIRGYVADYTHDGEFPLIGRQGALCGNVNLASGKFHATEHAVVVQPKIEMNVHWLYYALNAMNLGQYATGAAQPGLAVSKLETLSIEIPNISEQNKIAQTLYKVEQLVNFRKQQLAKLDELVKARFVEMFGEPSSNPMGWLQTTVGAECYYIKDGPHKSLTDVGMENGYPFISVRNIVNGYIDFSTAKYISEADYKDAIKKCCPEKGDILYSKGGTTGIAKLVDIDIKFANWVHLAVLKFNHNEFNGSFFEKMLNCDYCYKQSQMLTKGIANRDLVLSAMAQIKIYKPPILLQNQFAAFVERVDQQKQTVQQSLEKLELMKKALMQEYFG